MSFGFVNRENMVLLTDLYELTMAQSYFNSNMNSTAIFDLFARKTDERSYLLSAGLEQVIYYLENVRFSKDDIEFLKKSGRFTKEFLRYLENFRFTGNLYAVDEGEIIFENEPFLTIEAPLIEAQIVETFIINTVQISTLVATKALRCYSVAQGTKLVDFGLRRAHGTDAGMKAARSSYIGGFIGTSNVLASKIFNIPSFGTMAHSYILAHNNELEAFRDFIKSYPENSTLLVDTFDTVEGVKNAIKAVRTSGLESFKGIRLDSGDIVKLAKESRALLDEAGFKEAMIFVSGGLNEYKIKEYLEAGAPVDGWGVGTELVVSADLPYLDCAYKLAEYGGIPKMKLSPGKETFPGRKQIFRRYRNGIVESDTIGLFDEKIEGVSLMKSYIEKGEMIRELPSIERIREKALENFERLPQKVTKIDGNETLKPTISKKLQNLLEETKRELEKAYPSIERKRG